MRVLPRRARYRTVAMAWMLRKSGLQLLRLSTHRRGLRVGWSAPRRHLYAGRIRCGSGASSVLPTLRPSGSANESVSAVQDESIYALTLNPRKAAPPVGRRPGGGPGGPPVQRPKPSPPVAGAWKESYPLLPHFQTRSAHAFIQCNTSVLTTNGASSTCAADLARSNESVRMRLPSGRISSAADPEGHPRAADAAADLLRTWRPARVQAEPCL